MSGSEAGGWEPDMAAGERPDKTRLRNWTAGLTLTWTGILLFAASFSLAADRPGPRPKIPTLRVEPAGDLNGEVAVYDANGRVTKRFVLRSCRQETATSTSPTGRGAGFWK
jgi:hypothetical protein